MSSFMIESHAANVPRAQFLIIQETIPVGAAAMLG